MCGNKKWTCTVFNTANVLSNHSGIVEFFRGIRQHTDFILCRNIFNASLVKSTPVF